jgi:hypothetical protein
MKRRDQVGSVLDVVGRFPRCGLSGIFFPLYKVLDFLSDKSGVENGGKLKFGSSVDFHGRRLRLGSVGDNVCVMGFQ